MSTIRNTILSLTLLAAVSSASAWGNHGYGRHHGGPSPWTWAAPLVIGGAIGYGVSRYTPPPNPAPIVINLPPAPVGYHYEPFHDEACRCTNYGLVRDRY